jgi:hypothetical protein
MHTDKIRIRVHPRVSVANLKGARITRYSVGIGGRLAQRKHVIREIGIWNSFPYVNPTRAMCARECQPDAFRLE